jgi:glycosyltransferase involved in cell wall biosynthesis
MISGSVPPSPCGVGDYSMRLANELAGIGVEVRLLTHGEFFALKQGGLIKSHDVLHIQYPTAGYGWSLLPHYISSKWGNVVVTVHEFSKARILRRLSEIVFFITAKRVIFTDPAELGVARKYYADVNKKAEVIYIGSNIPRYSEGVSKKNHSLVFFGLIRRQKGIEEFLELAKIVRSSGLDLEISLIGSIPKGNYYYYNDVKEACRSLGVSLYINEPAEVVSRMLGEARFAYLHYPDGLSLRRGSFLACVENDVIVLSNGGKNTPAAFAGLYLDVASPVHAFDVLRSQCDAASFSHATFVDPHRMEAFQWSAIARRHVRLYESMLNE